MMICVARDPGLTEPRMTPEPTNVRSWVEPMFKAIFAALTLFGLAACTVQATAPASGAAAGVEVTNRVIESPTSVYMPPELASLSQKIEVAGVACGAYSFPTSIGPGLAETIRLTNKAALKNEVPGGTAAGPPNGAEYNIAFALESIEASVSFPATGGIFFPGYLVATLARAEVRLQVHVISRKNGEVVRTVVEGLGASNMKQGFPNTCEDGSKALSEAFGMAFRNLAKDYIDRVINSGAFH